MLIYRIVMSHLKRMVLSIQPKNWSDINVLIEVPAGHFLHKPNNKKSKLLREFSTLETFGLYIIFCVSLHIFRI